MDYRTFSLLGIICEEILMKFVYTSDKDDEIVKHEKIMLEKCSNILDSYRAIFKEYNCSLEVGYGWENFLKKEHSTNRLPLKMGMSVIFIARYRKMVQRYV